MKLSMETKIKRAMDKMPIEIIIQYSSQTDNIDVLKENALNEAKEEGKELLEVFLTYATEVLETYESELLGHINNEMKEDYPTEWKQERAEIVKYIKLLNRYIGGEAK